jgi:hypothetical protein
MFRLFKRKSKSEADEFSDKFEEYSPFIGIKVYETKEYCFILTFEDFETLEEGKIIKEDLKAGIINQISLGNQSIELKRFRYKMVYDSTIDFIVADLLDIQKCTVIDKVMNENYKNTECRKFYRKTGNKASVSGKEYYIGDRLIFSVDQIYYSLA